MLKNPKIAIVSDTVSGGGAEKVLMTFLSMFPESDLYTLYIFPEARKRINKQFPKVKIKTSLFQILIKKNEITKYISIIKFFSWIYWECLDLKRYDLIISSSHSYMSKNVKKGDSAKHISYIHTPPRFLYNEYCEIKLAKKIPLRWLRQIDKNGSRRPDKLIANSENVKKRIKKYYNIDAQVVYPPVKIGSINKKNVKKEYYICLSRLVKQKGIDLAIDVCTKHNLPLYVIGSGDEYYNLKKRSGKTIKFIRKCNDRKKMQFLSQAKALIYPSIEEDFGIVPIEAMSVGTPVIGFASGGVKETIEDGTTGVLFYKHTEESLEKAIEKFNNLEWDQNICYQEASRFSEKVFIEKIKEIIRIS